MTVDTAVEVISLECIIGLTIVIEVLETTIAAIVTIAIIIAAVIGAKDGSNVVREIDQTMHGSDDSNKRKRTC